jgi:hypothetical protein
MFADGHHMSDILSLKRLHLAQVQVLNVYEKSLYSCLVTRITTTIHIHLSSAASSVYQQVMNRVVMVTSSLETV